MCYEIFIAAEAKYFGCFVDQHSRDLSAAFTDLGRNNGVQACRAHCTSKGDDD